jgi:hypothetical protein
MISWCFLQRADMDGILDASSEMFADLSIPVNASFTWLKATIVSFRLAEQIAHFHDLGWTVKPLLVCRDVRAVYASLRTKAYGRNGTTAEDPPLRLRFRRFRQDWEMFLENKWPVIQFESFLRDPEEALRAACTELGLPWDEAMLTWPKPRSAFRDARYGNETFNRTCGADLRSTLVSVQRNEQSQKSLVIPGGELAWLEKNFEAYNQVNGYPAHASKEIAPTAQDRDIPCFTATRRFQRKLRRSPFAYFQLRIARWLKTRTSAEAKPWSSQIAAPTLLGTPKPEAANHVPKQR